MAQPTVNPVPKSPARVEEERLELTYFVRDALMRRHAFDEQVATETADACVRAIAALEGNELASALSAFRQQLRRERDKRIRANLRTGNADEIARQEHLSVRRVYEIAGVRPPTDG